MFFWSLCFLTNDLRRPGWIRCAGRASSARNSSMSSILDLTHEASQPMPSWRPRQPQILQLCTPLLNSLHFMFSSPILVSTIHTDTSQLIAIYQLRHRSLSIKPTCLNQEVLICFNLIIFSCAILRCWDAEPEARARAKFVNAESVPVGSINRKNNSPTFNPRFLE